MVDYGAGLGYTADVMGIVSFFQSLIPAPKDPEGATVHIHCGLGEARDEGLGGTIAAIYSFDFNNSPVGRFIDGQDFVEGADHDMLVEQKDFAGVDAERISVTAGEDNLCISYMSLKCDSSGRGWAWLGDVGAACGQPSFMGNVPINDDANYRPRCTWLGATLGEEGGPISTSMKVNMPKYSTAKDTPDQIDPTTACDNTQWTADSAPIGARKLKKRSRGLASRLIVSPHAFHSAAEECANPLSYGPDVITLFDGTYCDMGSKTAYPLCSSEVQTNCLLYDAEQNILEMRDRKRYASALSRNITVWE